MYAIYWCNTIWVIALHSDFLCMSSATAPSGRLIYSLLIDIFQSDTRRTVDQEVDFAT